MDKNIIERNGRKYKCVASGDGFQLIPLSDGDGSVIRGRVRTVSDSVVIHARDELGSEQSRKRNNSESNTRSSDPKDDDDDDDDEGEGEGDDEDDDDEEEEDGADGEGPQPKKKLGNAKTGKCHWKEEEEDKLLQLCFDKHILDRMDGKFGRLPHAQIFKLVSGPLNDAKLGSKKTPKQCQSKFKKLKKTFFDYKRSQNRSGAGRKDCKHLDKLSLLFDRRPRANFAREWGTDTQEDASMEEPDDSASALGDPPTPPASTSTTTSTSSTSCGAHSKMAQPKYKSTGSRSNPMVAAITSIAASAKEDMKETREWMSVQMDKQFQAQSAAMGMVAESFKSGISSLIQILRERDTPPLPVSPLQLSPQSFVATSFPGPVSQAATTSSVSLPFINFSSVQLPGIPPSQPASIPGRSPQPTPVAVPSSQPLPVAVPSSQPLPDPGTSLQPAPAPSLKASSVSTCSRPRSTPQPVQQSLQSNVTSRPVGSSKSSPVSGSSTQLFPPGVKILTLANGKKVIIKGKGPSP